MVSREPPSLGIGCPEQVSARGPPFAILVKNALPGLLLTSVSDGREGQWRRTQHPRDKPGTPLALVLYEQLDEAHVS